MNTRALVIFLGVNVVCSVAIGYKYFTKEKPTHPPVIQQQSIAIIPAANTAINTEQVPQVQIQEPTFAAPQVLSQTGVISASPNSNNPIITTATQLQSVTNLNTLNNNTANPHIGNHANGNVAATLSPIDMAMNELRNKAIPSTPIAQTPQVTPDANASGSLVQHILNMKPEMSQNEIPSAISSAKGLQTSVINEDIKKTALNVDKIEKVCTILGPLDLKSKATMDVILSKDANVKNAEMEVSQKPVFEIYWNLGKSREEAEVLFQKQKQNGTMQDAKFVLFQDDEKQWIVPIAEINSSEDYAKNMTTQLAITANKNNAGGKWNYRTKPNAYFYKFEDFSQIGKSTKHNIDVMLNVNKAPC